MATIPFTPLIIGLLVRAVLAPYTSWSNDVAVWFRASVSGFYGVDLYGRPGFAYPPVWGYLLQAIGALVRLVGLGPNFFGVRNPDFSSLSSVTGDFSVIVTSPMYNVVFKTLLFGFDVATAVLIYRLVVELTADSKRATFAFVAWFLNPLVIYESAVHGAPDTIVGFMVLATVTLVLFGHPFWAGVAWAIGVLLKLSPLALGLALVLVIAFGISRATNARRLNLRGVAIFIGGATLSAVCLLLPLIFSGSVSRMLLNVFAREQGLIAIGGLSLTGIRHFRLFFWFFQWAVGHGSIVIRASLIAQAAAAIGWTLFAVVVGRKNPVIGLFGGAVGILSSLMLLAPIAQPTYVLWWLPALVVVVVVNRSGFWQLGILSLAPLVFELAIHGPLAVAASLSTYTNLLPTQVLVSSVLQWFFTPGRLWGTYASDDFFGPAALMTAVALVSLFAGWLRNQRVDGTGGSVELIPAKGVGARHEI